MAVVLTGTGGLFTRLGRYFYQLQSANAFRGTGDLTAGGLRSLGDSTDRVAAQFQSSRQDLISNLYSNREAARQALASYCQSTASECQRVLVAMVNDDNPLASATLPEAMAELILQMVDSSDSVDANTVSVSVAMGTNNGTATVVSSLVGRQGLPREYAIAEIISADCETDAPSGSATEGLETWRFTAPAPVDQLAWNWPAGSGASTTTQSLSPDSGRQMLVNGDFEDFTVTNTPDNWVIDVGSAGTTIFRSSSPYQGTYALQFTGNGSQLTSIYQPFDDETLGSAAIPVPSTVYLLSCYVKVSATPSAGILEIALTDTSGTILQDDQGADLKVTKDLTGVSTTYVLVHKYFSTGAILPTSRFRVRLSTALDNTKTVTIDNLILAPATEVYPGGPFADVISGSVRSQIGDSAKLTVANDWAGQFQYWFQRCFDMRSLGYQIPSNTGGTETIADSLIA